MSLSTQPIKGVRGQTRPIKIQIEIEVSYGQWAIHLSPKCPHGLQLSHIETGRGVPLTQNATEIELRDLISRLLSVPDFRTIRAKKALRQMKQIVKAWAKDLHGNIST